MTRYWFRGGPLDGTWREVPGSLPEHVIMPHPDDVAFMLTSPSVPDRNTTMRTLDYYRVRVSDGNSESRIEYWTAEKKAADLAAQQPATLEQRVRELELQVQVMSRTEDELVKGFAELSAAVTKLAERFERMLEVNELWDGS